MCIFACNCFLLGKYIVHINLKNSPNLSRKLKPLSLKINNFWCHIENWIPEYFMRRERWLTQKAIT